MGVFALYTYKLSLFSMQCADRCMCETERAWDAFRVAIIHQNGLFCLSFMAALLVQWKRPWRHYSWKTEHNREHQQWWTQCEKMLWHLQTFSSWLLEHLNNLWRWHICMYYMYVRVWRVFTLNPSEQANHCFLAKASSLSLETSSSTWPTDPLQATEGRCSGPPPFPWAKIKRR